MAILNSTDELKKHVGIAKSFSFDNFQPYIDRAVYAYTRKYVGYLHEELAEEASGENADIINRARLFLQRAIANFGMFIYLPLGSVFMDSSGLSNYENETRKPLSWQQVNDIRRELLSAGHEAMDLLLEYLEANKGVFTTWAASEFYTESVELLVNNTSVFQKYYNIFGSRQTYLALQPSIRQVEDQYISTFLCPQLVLHLKTGVHNDNQKLALSELQKAVVSFTVAKVCREGLFVVEATGMKLKFDLLPHETAQPADIAFLRATAQAQEDNGRNYIESARRIIAANEDDFAVSGCNAAIIENSDFEGYKPILTKSTIGL